MHILTLATEFPPAHGYGLGRYAAEHTAALVAQGCEVAVACSNHDGQMPNGVGSRAGVEVNNAPIFMPVRGYTWVADVLQNSVQLEARAIEMARRNGGFDVLHIHDWLAASAAKSLRDLLQIPLVVTMHDTVLGRKQEELGDEEQYIAQMERWVCEQADAVLANSEFIRQELIGAYDVPEGKVSVVGCGVRPESFVTDTDIRLFKGLFGSPDQPLVAFVGRLAHMKGPHVLLEAIPHVLGLEPGVRFAFAGDGQMRHALQQRAAELDLRERARFIGYLGGKVLATFYRAADVVVVPSLYEPFGMVAAEAMVCGTPVIASDTGGLSEIMANDGECALPAPPNDPMTLARAILHLLHSPARAAQMAARGQEIAVGRYGWDDVARRTVQTYERVVN